MTEPTETKTSLIPVVINDAQRIILSQQTPRHLVRWRKGKGGRQFPYIDGAEVIRILNTAFGWAWDFEADNEELILWNGRPFEVKVRGRLTVHAGETVITKTQFGGQAIEYVKDKATGEIIDPVTIADAYKGAATDAMKKCASALGVALDLYDSDSAVNQAGPREGIPAKLITRLVSLMNQARAAEVNLPDLPPFVTEQTLIEYGKALADKLGGVAPELAIVNTAPPPAEWRGDTEQHEVPPPIAQTETTTGNGKGEPTADKPATFRDVKIKTANWITIQLEIAAALPRYQNKAGKPDSIHILGALAAQGVRVISDTTTADELIAELKLRHKEEENV